MWLLVANLNRAFCCSTPSLSRDGCWGGRGQQSSDRIPYSGEGVINTNEIKILENLKMEEIKTEAQSSGGGKLDCLILFYSSQHPVWVVLCCGAFLHVFSYRKYDSRISLFPGPRGRGKGGEEVRGTNPLTLYGMCSVVLISFSFDSLVCLLLANPNRAFCCLTPSLSRDGCWKGRGNNSLI